jgi:alanyl-tRNA synthetase
MTSAEIRQSFLGFYHEKKHSIVPSSSLLPDAPNLMFTNAGMNQFVPYFLGQTKPHWKPPRTADTQKCIRAGGKHNDLEDVGLDTYHHTFFEMLGNWSFGDYFKKEAIDWAWELLVQRWHFPKERLYTTYFGGDDKTTEDTEARNLWLRYLPAEHVVPGSRKDNFWMMGDTGPCGPCSEIHIDLTPHGDGGAKLVNAGTPHCIEIWNLVFIQFNANPDGSLTPLSAKHVDTGMGFERVCSIIQCTDGLKDFSKRISNYETDVCSPIFRELEKLCSNKKYTSTLPEPGILPLGQVKVDVAFRVIADHIRCLSFAIADGIQPSNEGRGYVLRRILRRAVRYGRDLGFQEPFFYKLVDGVVANFGVIFP